MKKPSSTSVKLKTKNKVLVAGTFDLLHAGHKNLFAQAQNFGEVWAVVARDKNVLKIKGRLPVENENVRLQKVQNCPEIFCAKLGSENNFLESIIEVSPKILALGYDQKLPIAKKLLPKEIQIIRLRSYKSQEYKTSIIRQKCLK